MKKVHVLRSQIFKPNENGFIAPLYRSRKELRHRHIDLHFYKHISDRLFDCDILCLSSKHFIRWWDDDGFEHIKNFLLKARDHVEKIFWFDLADSTGTTHFKLLPYVDKYIKNQLLKDKSLYQKSYYGMRISTDFYHRQFSIDDGLPHSEHLNISPTTEDLDKICVGWNSGLAYYGRYRNYIEKYAWRYGALHALLKARIYSTSQARKIPFSGRIGTSYARKTVSIPRQTIKDQLKNQLALDKISHRRYFKEMQHSSACLSPFGNGEISLRDFEITLSGAAMIKQNMDHCETWPNLWIKDRSYLDFSWDLSDLKETVNYAIHHPKKMQAMAQTAQAIYHDAFSHFVPRFIELIK